MTVRIELEGHLGSDPKTRTVNGRDYTELSVAVGQGYRSRQTDQWVDQGTAWYAVHPVSKRAGQEAVLLHKGDAVIVAGMLRVDEFTRADGSKGFALKVAADAIYPSRIERRASNAA